MRIILLLLPDLPVLACVLIFAVFKSKVETGLSHYLSFILSDGIALKYPRPDPFLLRN